MHGPYFSQEAALFLAGFGLHIGLMCYWVMYRHMAFDPRRPSRSGCSLGHDWLHGGWSLLVPIGQPKKTTIVSKNIPIGQPKKTTIMSKYYSNRNKPSHLQLINMEYFMPINSDKGI